MAEVTGSSPVPPTRRLASRACPWGTVFWEGRDENAAGTTVPRRGRRQQQQLLTGDRVPYHPPGNLCMVSKYKQEFKNLAQLLEKFPKDKIEEVLFDKWSLKELIGHLNGWTIFFTKILNYFKEGKEAPRWGSLKEFNQKSVADRKQKSWKTVHKELLEGDKKLLETYESIPKALQKEKIWENKTQTPTKLLEINAHHYKKHAETIKRVLKKLE
jgi:hypothetical protein